MGNIHRGRGRPKRLVEAHAATPETLARAAKGMHRAPLDVLLAERLLSPDAHWAGMHLRRLHFLLRATPGMVSGFYWLNRQRVRAASDASLEQATSEYRQAQAELMPERLWQPTLNLVCADGDRLPDETKTWSEGMQGCVRLFAVWNNYSMGISERL